MIRLGDVLFRTAVAMALTGGAATACGTEPATRSPSPTSPATSETTPPATSGTTPPATSGTATTPASPGATQSAAQGVPVYQPSTVVSRAPGSTVLTTTDPVGKVSDFYVDAVERGGWQTISKNVTPDSTSITVSKPGRGASISVAKSGSGTVISISGYPSP